MLNKQLSLLCVWHDWLNPSVLLEASEARSVQQVAAVALRLAKRSDQKLVRFSLMYRHVCFEALTCSQGLD